MGYATGFICGNVLARHRHGGTTGCPYPEAKRQLVESYRICFPPPDSMGDGLEQGWKEKSDGVVC